MTWQSSMLLPCDVASFYMGGITKTTFKETWRHGKTVSVRVPEKLKTQVIELARQLDKGERLVVYSKIDKHQIIKILDSFIELKHSQYGNNNAQKGNFSRRTRSWDVFNQLYNYLKN